MSHFGLRCLSTKTPGDDHSPVKNSWFSLPKHTSKYIFCHPVKNTWFCVHKNIPADIPKCSFPISVLTAGWSSVQKQRKEQSWIVWKKKTKQGSEVIPLRLSSLPQVSWVVQPPALDSNVFNKHKRACCSSSKLWLRFKCLTEHGFSL